MHCCRGWRPDPEICGKQLALVQSAFEKALDTWQFAARAATGASMPPEQQAPGFTDPA
jgi:hypothetical protein